MAKAKPFDAAEYLDSPEMIAAYLNEALESEDASAIAVAIGTVARGRGKSRTLPREFVPGTGRRSEAGVWHRHQGASRARHRFGRPTSRLQSGIRKKPVRFRVCAERRILRCAIAHRGMTAQFVSIDARKSS